MSYFETMTMVIMMRMMTTMKMLRWMLSWVMVLVMELKSGLMCPQSGRMTRSDTGVWLR